MNGNKLRKLRENKGLLQKQLGKELNISTSTIGMYEQGRREPDNTTLKNLANFFEVSTDYLLDNENLKLKEDSEIYEKEVLKKVLINAGFMTNGEDISKNELERLMKFLKNNKDFIKNCGNEEN